MKASIYSGNGRVIITVEAENIKQLFRQIAQAQEVLAGDQLCGSCGSTEIRFRVRHVDKYDYYEQACDGCGAALAFGQLQDGVGLYPRRKSDNGAPLANRGWLKYLGKPSAETPPTK